MPVTRGKKSAVYGALTDGRGNGTPVAVEGAEVLGPVDRVGYTPERLDSVIEAFIRNAEASVGLLLKYAPMLGAMMQKAQTELSSALEALSPPEAKPEGETPPDFPLQRFEAIVNLSDTIARVLERISKITKQSSEAMDDATRLRAFIVGVEEGDDGGLAGKGENELRRMVLEAAQGWQKPVENA
jgi:hypothetical protein